MQSAQQAWFYKPPKCCALACMQLCGTFWRVQGVCQPGLQPVEQLWKRPNMNWTQRERQKKKDNLLVNNNPNCWAVQEGNMETIQTPKSSHLDISGIVSNCACMNPSELSAKLPDVLKFPWGVFTLIWREDRCKHWNDSFFPFHSLTYRRFPLWST